MLRKILIGSGLLLMLLLVVGVSVYQVRYKPMLTLFDEDKIAENFRRMSDIFPHHSIEASDTKSRLPRADEPFSFSVTTEKGTISLEDTLRSFSTTGFLIIRNDSILYESYFKGADSASTFTSFSLSKSITSMLVGIALKEGKLRSIHDPIEQYLPHLQGSGYEGVTIEHVLQMATGIKFSEDYDDPDSDINQLMFSCYAYFEPLREWVAQFDNEIEPGSKFHYQSINTAILGMILSEVYQQPLSDILEEKIWQPMGAEGDASWITDEHGTEIAFGFLNARLRDYARIGLIMLHEGQWNGSQILPDTWVEACTSIDDSVPRPKKEEGNAYQYHWWIPDGEEGEFHASGYMGQIIYINPLRHVVIVKTGLMESKHLPLIRSIASSIAPLADSTRSPDLSLID